MSDGLQLASDLSLPLETVTQTSIILAKKGAGKTNTAVVLVEEASKQQQQVVVIDPTGAWYGIRSSADGEAPGFEFVIFGGEHSDVPLEDTAGELVATTIVEQGFSAVLDLSLFRKAQLQRFMAPFLETLYRLNRNAMLLVVDEADTVAPQKPFGEEARTLGAMQDVVRRGRIRGIGCVMITQRPQVLNKDVLTQADMLIALRMSHPKDMAAVKEWVDVHAEPAVAKEMLQSLPSLHTGNAWFWAPDRDLFARVQVRRRETFDSSATPKPGERRIEPKAVAAVDLKALGVRIAETIARAEENNPAKLRAEVQRLRKELDEKGGADVNALEQLQQDLSTKDQRIAELEASLSDLETQLDQWSSWLASAPHGDGVAAMERAAVSREPIVAAAPAVRAVPSPAAPAKTAPVTVRAEGLSSAQIKILTALGSLAACGINSPERTQVAFFAGYSNVKSGGFAGPLGQLTTEEYVQSGNGALMLTSKGQRAIGGTPKAATAAELHEKLRSLLPGPEWKLLEILIKRRGRAIERPALASEAGYGNVKSGGFADPLGRLTTLGLAEVPSPGQVRGTGLLFLEAR